MTAAKPKTPHRGAAIKRILVIWAIQTVALIVGSLLMPKVEITNFGIAIIAAALIGILNAVLWPILSYILVPFAVLTLGLVALLMNGLVIWLASLLVEGFTVTDFWGAFWLALLLAAINLILSSLLTIDDDHSWYRNQVQRRMKRVAKPEQTDVPGIIFLEIDGLAHPILEKALKEGYMPTLQSWLERGSHVLTGWETDTSSQTSASQAGFWQGDTTNFRPFGGYDKSGGEIMPSSNSKILPDFHTPKTNPPTTPSQCQWASILISIASKIKSSPLFRSTKPPIYHTKAANSLSILIISILFLKKSQIRSIFFPAQRST